MDAAAIIRTDGPPGYRDIGEVQRNAGQDLEHAIKGVCVDDRRAGARADDREVVGNVQVTGRSGVFTGAGDGERVRAGRPIAPVDGEGIAAAGRPAAATRSAATVPEPSARSAIVPQALQRKEGRFQTDIKLEVPIDDRGALAWLICRLDHHMSWY